MERAKNEGHAKPFVFASPKGTGDVEKQDYERWPLTPRRTAQTAKLIGYARVSTEDQKLDMQLDALQRAGVDHVFYDHGISGAKANRPGLDAALNTMVEGDTLVVYKLDRLGRSVQNLTDLIGRFDDEGIQFCSLSEGINTATPGGKLVFHVFASMAEFYRDLLRENTIEGLKAARARGSKIGRPRRMTDEDVKLARVLIKDDGLTYAKAARHFGVSESTMFRELQRFELLGVSV